MAWLLLHRGGTSMLHVPPACNSVIRCSVAPRFTSRVKPQLGAALIACVLLWGTAAAAQPAKAVAVTGEGSTAATSASLEQPTWYGWQTLSSDLLGATLIMVSAEASHEDFSALVGASCLLLGAPVIHAVHRNWLGLGVSLSVRGTAGLALWGGLSVLLGDGPPVLAVGLVGVTFIAGLAALLLDALMLGFEEPRPQPYALIPWVERAGAGIQLISAF